MPEPTKIPRAFADSGDKNSIPDSSGALGFASWQEGFPAITGTPFSQGGVAPKRADFNGIFNALSAATVWQQQGGFYAYDNATDYEVGNIVLYSGEIYVCLVANGPGSAVKDPTDAAIWVKMATLANAVPISGNPLNPMTGTLAGGGTAGDWYISMAHNNSIMHLLGGTAASNCASLHLYGDSQSNNPSLFSLMTSRNGVTYSLQGRPDGTLKWDGKEIVVDHEFATVSVGSVTVPNNTITNLTSYTYTKTGIYIAQYVGYGRTNGTGTRTMFVATSTTAQQMDKWSMAQVVPVSSGYTPLIITKIENITTANTTRYLNFQQTSGGNLTCEGYIAVVRLGGA